MMSKQVAVLAGLVLASPLAASAADSPFLGKWTLDVANATMMMDPKPKSVEVNVTRDDAKRIAWTETVVDAKGKRHTEKYDLPLNGKLTAGAEKGEKMSSTRVDDHTLKFHSVSDKGNTRDETCTSDGGTTVTCEGTYSENGKTGSIKEVYTKKMP